MKTKDMTRMALLTAIALTIFMVELQLPGLSPVPGIKLGLSNIVTVWAVFTMGPKKAAMILAAAIEKAEASGAKAGSDDYRQAIIDAMKATDMDCVTGHVTFNEYNNPEKTAAIINIVGGGTKEEQLSQFAATACGRPVYAGPVEATAIGNIAAQAIALGAIKDMWEAREIIANSFEIKEYQPEADKKAAWDEAYGRFLKLIEKQ